MFRIYVSVEPDLKGAGYAGAATYYTETQDEAIELCKAIAALVVSVATINRAYSEGYTDGANGRMAQRETVRR